MKSYSKLDASAPENGTEDKVDSQVILERKKKVDSIWEEMNKPVSVSSSISQNLNDGNQTVKSNDKTDTQDAPNEEAERKESGPSSLTSSTLPKNLVSSSPSTSATPASNSSNPNVNSAASVHSNIEKHKRRPGPAKRSSGLSALASKYGVDLGPAKKLNTLEKSKQDWNKFVDKEGIKDELQYKNKDGYLEKVDFLKRMDEVQDQKIRELKKGSTSKR
ncbi:bucentaur or craniofacial development-domain-containing protein [Paraphysoderma sedebokerense]|nr:bucentaur or craniofacial development-domain-containing protein [Paraphysoderma sedebokerense]KAI9137853.1 bucentaur or craniofacial development-domain-containing protein [Paraphysoderma sedebokerense]